jgi:carboxylesterase type B
MVWVHGGLFMYGSSDIFGANYFADEDIILVVISYRVASLGKPIFNFGNQNFELCNFTNFNIQKDF